MMELTVKLTAESTPSNAALVNDDTLLKAMPNLKRFLLSADQSLKIESTAKLVTVAFDDIMMAAAASRHIGDVVCESASGIRDWSAISNNVACRIVNDILTLDVMPSAIRLATEEGPLADSMAQQLLNLSTAPLEARQEWAASSHLIRYSLKEEGSEGLVQDHIRPSLVGAVMEGLRGPLTILMGSLVAERLAILSEQLRGQPSVGLRKGHPHAIDISLMQSLLPTADDLHRLIKSGTAKKVMPHNQLQIIVDFSSSFGYNCEAQKETLAQTIALGSSPPPKQLSQSPALVASSPTAVGSIIHKAFRASQRATSHHSAPLLMEGTADEAHDGAIQRLSTARCLQDDDSNHKRPRENDELEMLTRGPRGLVFVDTSYMSSLAIANQNPNDVLSGLGKFVAPCTLVKRRESMRKLSALLPTSSHSVLSLSNVICSRPQVTTPQPQPLSCVAFPIVIGNTSQWLGEKSPPTANHKWTVYVRGVNNATLSGVIEHVTFVLHPSFGARAQQTVYKAPFLIEEVGWGEFDITIYIKFRHMEIFTLSSPTVTSPTSSASKGVYVKVLHALKFSHRNPLLLAAEAKVNQEVAVAMTQPPAIAFGNTPAGAARGGTNFQSVQFLFTNPTLTTAVPSLPTTPTALVHRLHCVPPNGNAYFGAPSYTPFALEETPVVAETRDELQVYHPTAAFIDEVKGYMSACSSYSAGLAPATASLDPQVFSSVIMKYSPLLCTYAGKFNEWHLYHLQAAQDKRLVASVESDLKSLVRHYVQPMARMEMQSAALHQLRASGVQ